MRLSIGFALGLALLSSAANASTPGSAHGTINVLLGNPNGIVLKTDSRLTYQNKTFTDTGQKLFQIDQKTVCSFAGLAAYSAQYRELALDTGGVIEGFSHALAQSGPVSFETKVNSLALALLQSYSSVFTVYNEVHADLPETQALIVLVVGYGDDGSVETAKIVLNIKPTNAQASIGGIDFAKPGKKFFFLTAGIDKEVNSLLTDTSRDTTGVLRIYADAVKAGKADSLSLDELESLASVLELAATSDVGVGGPVQTAFLQDSKADFKPVAGLTTSAVPKQMTMMVNTSEKGGELPMYKSLLPTIHINEDCDHASLGLDNAIIYGGLYDTCRIFYNGGPFRCDRSALFLHGSLVVGPKLTLNGPEVQTALKELPELTPVSYRSLHLRPDQLKQLGYEDSTVKP